jgi:cell division protein FtsL
MNRFPEYQLNAKVSRSRDKTALSRLALLLFCGLVLASGFVFAAKQHFAAVQSGYKSESLKLERKKLLEERQRLSLEREKVTAPARLDSAARELGLLPTTVGQLAIVTTEKKVQPAKSQTGASQTGASQAAPTQTAKSRAAKSQTEEKSHHKSSR